MVAFSPNLSSADLRGAAPARSGDLRGIDIDALFRSEAALAPATPVMSADCLLATLDGPVAACDLRPGDRVLTRDAGYVEVASVTSMPFAADAVIFAPGAIGNERVLILSAEQPVLLSSGRFAAAFGSREILVPAGTLGRAAGATRVAAAPGVSVLLAWAEAIFAEGAVLLAGSERAASPRYPLLAGREAEAAVRLAGISRLPAAAKAA